MRRRLAPGASRDLSHTERGPRDRKKNLAKCMAMALVAGLTSWNEGENFASLGIGHFIWYPKGQRGPFEESFPKLVSFIAKRGAKLPGLLLGAGDRPCPWNSRAEFLHAQNTSEMKQLRQFLRRYRGSSDGIPHFPATKCAAENAGGRAPLIGRTFSSNSSGWRAYPQGCYALVDYVNFKGEGVLHTERYQGQGWGLLQVLENMHGTSAGTAAVDEFARSAKAILTRRVQNAPAQRRESRWLPGWLQRVNSYSRG